MNLFSFGNAAHTEAISCVVSQLARIYGEYNLCRRVIRHPERADPFAYDRCSIEEWKDSIAGEDNIVAINRDNPFQVYTIFTGVDRSRVINSECHGYVTLVFDGSMHLSDEYTESDDCTIAHAVHNMSWRRIQSRAFRGSIRS